MRSFKQSPLPFQGQKRNFLTQFKRALKEFDHNGTYVDLFGGSGLLSHTTKQALPNARVVYNDYDNFSLRLANIGRTNALVDRLRDALNEYRRKQRITGDARVRVLDILREADSAGYVDWITISSMLLFSMRYALSYQQFEGETLYNRVRLSPYDATGYLHGVEVVRMDYKELFAQYRNATNVVFLIDPPYLNTDTQTYACHGSWQLSDYLDVLSTLHGQSYFYFTSNKSQLPELCRWISTVSSTADPFQHAHRTTVSTSVNYNSSYTDVMYHYKRNSYETAS